jgi:hypothetical protein
MGLTRRNGKIDDEEGFVQLQRSRHIHGTTIRDRTGNPAQYWIVVTCVSSNINLTDYRSPTRHVPITVNSGNSISLTDQGGLKVPFRGPVECF